MAKDYYQVLGVGRTATEADIKTAFRRLAHEHHPDKKQGNEAKFKEINEAYQVLGNKEKREQYDRFGTTFDTNGRPAGGFSWQDMGGANPFGNFNFQGAQFDFGDISDIFGDVFGFGAQRQSRAPRSRRGTDIELTVPLTFEESYRGVEKQIEFKTDVICDICHGTGDDPSAKITECKTCGGEGIVTSVRATLLGQMRSQTTCTECGGTGKKSSKRCNACMGRTTRSMPQSLTVSVPAGIDEEHTIRLSGKGSAGLHAGPRGDIFIRVKIQSHPLFTREGYNIRSSHYVPLSVLTEGGSALVDSPAGPLKLKVPAYTKSGTSFVLKGKGFERLTGRGYGDHIVTLHARVPEKLSSHQKRLLAEFETSLEGR